MLEPRPGHEGYEFVDKIVGGVIPQSFRPAVDKGIQEAMLHGELAGAPVQGVTVRLVDGQYHNVDSSEMAFKIAGSMAFKDAYQKADPMLLEPIMELEVTVPDEAVGAVNGDLNSRRGRLHGMEPLGGMTTIKAEVPMAEVLTYSQSLTSLTGGRGDYHMSFLRYEEVPGAHRAEAHRGREKATRGGDKETVTAPSISGKAARPGDTPLRPPSGDGRPRRQICGRTLLVGEDTTRFSPDGIEYVDVCPLCRGQAWRPAGIARAGPSLPVLPAAPRRASSRGSSARRNPGSRRSRSRSSTASPPTSRRSSRRSRSSTAAPHRRTIEGLMRSLGTPRVAVGPTERATSASSSLGDLLVPLPRDARRVRPRADDRAWLRRGGAGSGRHRLERRRRRAGRLVPRVAPSNRPLRGCTPYGHGLRLRLA